MAWTSLNGNISDEGSYWLTSMGNVVELNDDVGIGDPIKLIGHTRDAQLMLAQTYQWKKLVETYDLSLVGAKLSESHAWQLRLSYRDGEFDLLLGREDVVTRLSRFLSLFDNQFTRFEEQLTRVDARYPNGLAITFDEKEEIDQLAVAE